MKKTLLTIICAGAMSSAAFAQGFINYSLSFTDVTFDTNSAYSPLLGGNDVGGTSGLIPSAASGVQAFDFALLYQPTSTVGVMDTNVFDGSWSSAAYSGTTFAGTNGNAYGRASTTGNSGAQAVPWATGTTDNIVIVGWSANLGTTWLAVSNVLANWSTDKGSIVGPAFFGETTIGYINPSVGSGGAPVNVDGGTPIAAGQPIFSLNTPLYELPVPEPATIALAGLGGLSMLLLRRRNKA